MAKPFSLLRDKMSPERRARNDARIQQAMQEMPLAELRAARALTQEHLAAILGIQQAAISKLERRADMYVSTLSKVIEAMGGTLEIRAIFPEGAVRITHIGAEAELAEAQT